MPSLTNGSRWKAGKLQAAWGKVTTRASPRLATAIPYKTWRIPSPPSLPDRVHMYAATPTGRLACQRTAGKASPGFFQKLFYHSAYCKILCKRLSSDDVYPLSFLPFGSEGVPPKLLETTSAGVFKTASYRKTLTRSVWMHWSV